MAEPEAARAAERGEFELARDRDFLRTVADATPALLVVVDRQSNVAGNSVNKSFERTMGWTEHEMLGRSFVDLFPPEDRGPARLGVAAAFAGDDPTERLSYWRTRYGDERGVAWTATPIVDMSGRELVLVCGVDVTDRERQEQELRASRTRIVQAAADARRVLERNLHDGAQQSLVTLSLTLQHAQTRLDSDPAEARRILEDSRVELAQALEQLRELARGIHPAVLTDRGLEAALEALVARSPVPVEVRVPTDRLPDAVEAAAYYIVAEALTNVAKYARATRATVSVRCDDDRVIVEVADNGVGGAGAVDGSGLRGLADRVAALGGALALDSPRGEGTRVRAEIPVT